MFRSNSRFEDIEEEIEKYTIQQHHLDELLSAVSDFEIDSFVKAQIISIVDEEMEYVDDKLHELQDEYDMWRAK